MRCVACSRFSTRRLRLALPIGALAAVMPAAAGVLTWPGAAPCNATLQDCIESAAADDVVEIASDGPINESIEIFGKSLTLRPAAGFAPVLQGGPFSDVIDAFGADTPVVISIEGMTVRDGSITAYQGGSGAFGVIIRDNVIEADALDANLTAIRIRTFGATPTGSVEFLIYNNEIRLGFLGIDDIAAIGVDDLPGQTAGLIMGNRILNGGPGSTYSAINIHNGSGVANFDLRYNRIEASGYNGGILLDQDDAAGAMTARVLNNLVTGTVDVTGPQPGAISLRANAGSIDATVSNNTLAGNDTGFIASVGTGASLSGVLANTLVADNADRGVIIGAAAAANFSNEHNLVFGNGADDFTPGPGTIQADPLFAGAGDFHPQQGSPVRDAGNTAFAADLDTDLDGALRVVGTAVDIGAWELSDTIFADDFDA
jgi:hypothetical protein